MSRVRHSLSIVRGDRSHMKALLIVCFALMALSAGPAFGHVPEAATADIGLEEKLGQTIAVDTVFADENGNHVNLKDLIDKPTIIAPVHLGCMHECPLLLTGLAQVLGKIELAKPGRDYQVITLSFDENDTPRIARGKKADYLKAVGRPFPEGAWKFLTGDKANIGKFTGSIGFKFQRNGAEFSHPVTLVVIAPGGKIIRYLNGVTFLPFEITMALEEAAEGRVGSTTCKILMHYFSYDSFKKTYAFNILMITMAVMVLFVGFFLTWLLVKREKSTGRRNS